MMNTVINVGDRLNNKPLTLADLQVLEEALVGRVMSDQIDNITGTVTQCILNDDQLTITVEVDSGKTVDSFHLELTLGYTCENVFVISIPVQEEGVIL